MSFYSSDGREKVYVPLKQFNPLPLHLFCSLIMLRSHRYPPIQAIPTTPLISPFNAFHKAKPMHAPTQHHAIKLPSPPIIPSPIPHPTIYKISFNFPFCTAVKLVGNFTLYITTKLPLVSGFLLSGIPRFG